IAQGGHAATVVEEEVELFVACVAPERIPFDTGLVEVFEQTLRLAQFVSRDAGGGAGNGECLSEPACDEQRLQSIDVDPGDADASVGFRGDESFGFEDAQRFPDRGDRGIEPLSDLVLPESFTAIEIAGKDLAAQAEDDHVAFRRYRLLIHVTTFRSYAGVFSLQAASHCAFQ